ncbi:MAG TPA: ChbG/HpnK family deacetylase [Solirubrobacterales bacterium]|nr:ChbG/HpnK family deacetylase [Solirubrobacterales bacterium]
MNATRLLIVNADDLGLCEAVNAGAFEAHERGVVTSASLMVRQGAAEAAVTAAASRPELALGLHLDLDGRHYETGEALALAPPAEECRAQLRRFRELVGRDPTHLDSHHHVHRAEPVRAAAEALAAELGVPLRGGEVRYEGRFFGRDGDGRPSPEAIAPERLVELIGSLPAGWTEIGCHPAAGPVPSSSYDAERRLELRALCDPRVREALNVTDVKLCSFAQV